MTDGMADDILSDYSELEFNYMYEAFKKYMCEVEVEEAPLENPAEERDWAELPRDVLMLIFRKVGMFEVLMSPSKVCIPWRKAARDDPLLWRRIDIGVGNNQHFPLKDKYREYDELPPSNFYERMLAEVTKVAVNWGGDRVEQLWVGWFCDDNLLEYISQRASNLKSLCIVDCTTFLLHERMAKALGRLKKLEELDIVMCVAPSGVMMKAIGMECPQLKRLKIKSPQYHGASSDEGIWTRLGIPGKMLHLEYLQLINICSRDPELLKILESCPNVEILDLRGSTKLRVNDDDIRARCSRIHTLVLPHDMLFQARNQYDDLYDYIYRSYRPLISSYSLSLVLE